MQTLQEFIAKWSGKGIDYDGHYGFQCVDLYRQYVQDVLGVSQSPGVPGAKEIWTTYLPQFFDRIANTPEGSPLPGDIMIWGDKYGEWGHVAVVTKADTKSFTCFSQNDPMGALPTLKTYTNWNPVLGWLHPKTQDNTYKGYDLTNADSMKVAVDVLVQLQSGELVKKEDLENINKKLADLEKSQKVLTLRVAELEGQDSDLSKQLSFSTESNRVLTEENQKLQVSLDYYQPYKSRYEAALQNTIDKFSTSQLFSMAWKKFWEDRKLTNKK